MLRYSLGKDERDEVADVHGFGGGAPARVQVKRLPALIGVQHLVHISNAEGDRRSVIPGRARLEVKRKVAQNHSDHR